MRRVAIRFVLGLASFAGSNMIAQQQPAELPPRVEGDKCLKDILQKIDRDKPAKDVIAALQKLEQLQHQMTSANSGGLMWFSALQHRDPEVRKNAVHTMVNLVAGPMDSAPTVAKRLMESLNDRDDVRAECFFALARLGPHAKPAIPRAIKEMKSGDPRVRRGAIVLIGSQAREEKHMLRHIIAALDDPDKGPWEKKPGINSVSWFAINHIRLVAKQSAKDAAPKLADLIKSKNGDEHYEISALAALALADPEEGLTLSIARSWLKTNDPTSIIKGAGLVGILGSHGKNALSDLIEAITRKPISKPADELATKIALVQTCQQLGPVAKDALPALRALATTSDLVLRREIILAIEKVQAKSNE